MTTARVAVLGTGGWGTALAGVLAANGHRVRFWGRDAAHVAEIASARENARVLPGARIAESVELTADPRAAAGDAELVVVAIPAQFVRATLAAFAGAVRRDAVLVSACKGLEIGSLKRPSEVFADVLGAHPFAVVSGPSHAEEVARGLPTSMAVASPEIETARRVRDVFGSPRLRLYADDDAVGVEIGGALKNVVAIAAGVCDGLALGDNAKAALVTRGLAEIARFGVAHGARPETFSGLAGIGDMLTTCYSQFGRNRAVGERVARGERPEAVLGSMTMVAEGVGTARALREAGASDETSMPICREVYAILFEGKSPRQSVTELMTRPPRDP